MKKGSLIFIKTDVRELFDHMELTISESIKLKKIPYQDFDFKNIDISNKELINETIESFSSIKKDNCRVYIRPSGTEPVLRILVEARNQKEVDSLSTKITTELSTKIYKISKTF